MPLLLFLKAVLLDKVAEVALLTGNYYEYLSSCERRHSWMDFSAVRFVVDVVRYGHLLFAYFYGTTMNTLTLAKEGTPGWISLL